MYEAAIAADELVAPHDGRYPSAPAALACALHVGLESLHDDGVFLIAAMQLPQMWFSDSWHLVNRNVLPVDVVK